jgi:hypothetical protein
MRAKSEIQKEKAKANKEKRLAYVKDWQIANKEKLKAYRKDYYEANKEKMNAYGKARYEANKEKVKAYREANREKVEASRRAYHEANKERRNGLMRAWYKANREKSNAYGAKRRAIEKQAMLPSSDLKLINKFYDKSFKLKGQRGEAYHVDHIIPLSIGGAHHQDNLRVISAIENLSRSKRRHDPSLGGVWADNDLAREYKKKHGIE